MADIPQTSGWQDLASALAAMSGGRLNGRTLQAFLDLQRYNAANGQFATSSSNALNQAKFQQDSPGKLAGQSVRGDILANGQDSHATGLPSYIKVPEHTGGFTTSMFSPETRQLGGQMSRNALASEMAAGPPPTSVSYPDAPKLPDVPEASALDSALNGGSDIASILAALDKLGGKDGGSLLDKLKGLIPGGGGGNGGGSGGGNNSPITPPQTYPGMPDPNNNKLPGMPGPYPGLSQMPNGDVVDTNGNIVPPEEVPPDFYNGEGGNSGTGDGGGYGD